MRKLETVIDLLDALQERHGWTSDRQIADGLSIPQGTVSNWRRGRTYPTGTHAITLAEALEIPPLLVLAIAEAERSDDEKARATWTKIARQIARGGAAAIAALLVGTGTYAPSAGAQDASASITSKRRRAEPQAA